jgi:hypothetical protein
VGYFLSTMAATSLEESGIDGADGKHGRYEFMATQVVYM